MFSSVRWSYKPSFKKFLGANFELNDLIVNFVPFVPIFGISLRLKREVQKFSYSYFTVVFSSVRWSYKPSFKKFLGANFELNDLIVNFVPFLPIFGISLRLKREVQKFSYSYFTVVFSSVRWSYKPSFKKFLGANFELNDFVPLLYHSVPLFEKWYKWYKKVRLGNYWELSDGIFYRINDENRQSYVDIMNKNPFIAKRKFVNVNA